MSEIRTENIFQKFINQSITIRKKDYEWDQKCYSVQWFRCDELNKGKVRKNEVILSDKKN